MMDEELDFLLGTMQWSFSRLNSFYNCPYEWFLHYIQCNKSENGFFGEYGQLIHKILEKYEKGELSLFELNEYYEEHFDEDVPHDAPPNKFVNIRQSYYDKGIDYLDNIDLGQKNMKFLELRKKQNLKLTTRILLDIQIYLLKIKKLAKLLLSTTNLQVSKF